MNRSGRSDVTQMKNARHHLIFLNPEANSYGSNESTNGSTCSSNSDSYPDVSDRSRMMSNIKRHYSSRYIPWNSRGKSCDVLTSKNDKTLWKMSEKDGSQYLNASSTGYLGNSYRGRKEQSNDCSNSDSYQRLHRDHLNSVRSYRNDGAYRNYAKDLLSSNGRVYSWNDPMSAVHEKELSVRRQSLSSTLQYNESKEMRYQIHLPSRNGSVATVNQQRLMHQLHLYAQSCANMYNNFVIPTIDSNHILPLLHPVISFTGRDVVGAESGSSLIGCGGFANRAPLYKPESDEVIDELLHGIYTKIGENLRSHAEEAIQVKKKIARRATEKWLAEKSVEQREAYMERAGMA